MTYGPRALQAAVDIATRLEPTLGNCHVCCTLCGAWYDLGTNHTCAVLCEPRDTCDSHAPACDTRNARDSRGPPRDSRDTRNFRGTTPGASTSGGNSTFSSAGATCPRVNFVDEGEDIKDNSATAVEAFNNEL